jgi:hypothetical protein
VIRPAEVGEAGRPNSSMDWKTSIAMALTPISNWPETVRKAEKEAIECWIAYKSKVFRRVNLPTKWAFEPTVIESGVRYVVWLKVGLVERI